MDWKLEVVTIPVSDIDRAKAFYAEQVGFNVDIDMEVGDGMRFVQLTPPGSGCSIHITTGVDLAPSGSMRGIILVVDDADAARRGLLSRGVDASPLRHFENGEWVDGPGEPWNLYVFFRDPDGNEWMVQERPKSEG